MKNLKGFAAGVIATLLFMTMINTVFAAQISKTITAVYRDIKITIDGKQIEPKDANGNTVEPFISDGTTYLPVRSVADAVGYDVAWDGDTNTVKLSSQSTVAQPLTPNEAPSIEEQLIKFNGTGDKIITNVNIPSGSFYAILTHKGSSNFISKLYYGDGKNDYELLSNKIGNYSGMCALRDLGGKAVTNGSLAVQADGDWTIEFKRVSGVSGKKLSGTGDYISGLIDITTARNIVTLTHDGSSNFIVKIIKENGGKYDYESIANEIGVYSGEKIANLESGSKYYIEVKADGNWTITIS